MAGYTYLQNLLKAIRLSEKQVEICLLHRSKESISAPPGRGLADLADEVLLCPTLERRRWSLQWLQAQLYRRALGQESRDRTLNDLLDSKHVDVVFGSWWQYPESSVFPSVGLCTWIHDFQFVHFPEFYSASSLHVTRRGILRSVDMADRVVVSSRDALKDLLSFGPGASQKARVLPFVADMSDQVYACDPGVVVRRYHLPDKFVFLPNQFWRHKNHRVVLEALRILSERGVRPNVVCTGLPHDPRMDTHFANLLKDVAEWGLHEQVMVLGLVPIDDVKALMRQAICVLNPSLFEGWSSTVEEAKSLGKRLVLSDLAVHREQDPSPAVFFEPRDPADLAQKLGAVWKDCSPGPDPELESVAQRTLPARLRKFGESFLRIMQEADPAGSRVRYPPKTGQGPEVSPTGNRR